MSSTLSARQNRIVNTGDAGKTQSESAESKEFLAANPFSKHSEACYSFRIETSCLREAVKG